MTVIDSTDLDDIVQKEWNIFIYPEEGEMPDTICDNLNWLADRVSRRRLPVAGRRTCCIWRTQIRLGTTVSGCG